jgi:hypothetical protein
VTNVADGDYILDVEMNPERSFEEVRYDNNSASKRVKVTHWRLRPRVIRRPGASRALSSEPDNG